VEDDFRRAKAAIADATGEEPVLARPPFGNVCPGILSSLEALGLSYVGWSVNTRDWLGGRESAVHLCGGGSIVLFHDGGRVNASNHGRMTRMLSMVVESQASYGRSSVTVPRLLASWDDGLVVACRDSGLRMLGWAVAPTDDGNASLVAYWMPQDAMGGLTYGVSAGGRRWSTTIPPMSKIDDWLMPVETGLPFGGAVELGEVWSSRYNVGMIRLNLGCGGHVLEGWDNFDVPAKAKPPVKPWRWNDPLPYADGSVDAVLVQHSLQHCHAGDYHRNLVEIFRVLRPGGRLVLKEADNRHYVWHSPGTTDRDGYIASSISQPEAVAALSAAGFDVCEDKDAIVGRWGDAINRQRRTLRGPNLFVVEGTKPEA